ncbi:hypothetical protein BC940DRAFT_12105 [Gongronella butleri]|nr:hypothetical protein BC940DRAFT_12105 [Gongronella butleri]
MGNNGRPMAGQRGPAMAGPGSGVLNRHSKKKKEHWHFCFHLLVHHFSPFFSFIFSPHLGHEQRRRCQWQQHHVAQGAAGDAAPGREAKGHDRRARCTVKGAKGQQWHCRAQKPGRGAATREGGVEKEPAALYDKGGRRTSPTRRHASASRPNPINT